MSDNQAAVQLEEVKRRAQSLLSSSGVAQDVKSEVQAMANLPLSPSEKYHQISAEVMLRENVTSPVKQQVLESMIRLVKAFSILEKYGCNLTSPVRPKYWRSVKHNNPVFRATVDAIKGGRRVLYLYGYTNQQIDGLSFPDDINDPDVQKVAEVTLEVMTLRLEVDMLIKGSHPHPENFNDIIPVFMQQEEVTCDAMVISPKEEPYPATPLPIPLPPPPHLAPLDHRPEVEVPRKPPTAKECNLCGGVSFVTCPSCRQLPFCEPCDDLFHRHPDRASHKRDRIQTPRHESCSICGLASVHAHCSTCDQRLCLNCDLLFHSHPDRQGHNRTVVMPAKTSRPSLSPWVCSHCTTVNEVRAVLCVTCDRPRLASPVVGTQDDPAAVPPSLNLEWQCKSCTMVNQGCSILCEACERPRLATRPSLAPASPSPRSLTEAATKWTCRLCTFANAKDATVCEMCHSPRKDSAVPSVTQSVLKAASPTKERPPVAQKPQPKPQHKPQPKPRASVEVKRQKMKDDGFNLIQHIREAEKRGVSPEELCAALSVCGGSNVNPCDWLTSELPHLLDEICAMAASVVQNNHAGDSGTPGALETPPGALETPQGRHPSTAGGGLWLTRAEAKRAWLTAAGETDKAVRQLLRNRQAKMRELLSLGFREVSKCEEALHLSGGEINEALSHLQRPLLEPFHQRIWSDQPEAPFDPRHPDKQRMCRRLLALYDLPSWGRCELALSLLQEPDVSYSLEDVVHAVKESQNRDFIMRLLSNECPCCLSNFPRSKMQSLTSCQCYVCHECFTQHFTVAVRDKHIRDMVCPVCSGPDINDPEQLDSYFSTLDIQLRDCLDMDVYDLYHKKLTEHALMKDPKFLWCCHCTSGFINDGDQLKVTCPSCRKSFCAQCKKPWEPQHQDLSCERFHQWKRDNDPDGQKQGLAGYLRDNGITCPNCRFQYALTKGGCIHFSCSQCRYQFCSGCNNPFHTTACKTPQCKITGLHAHHPRDCLFYLRDWDIERLQALLQRNAVEFNINPPDGTQADACGVMEQKDEGGQPNDSPCGVQTQPGRAGLCEKHYKEYLVSLINGHRLDPALLYDVQELIVACARYQVDHLRGENEDDNAYQARLLQKLVEVSLGEKVPRRK